MIAVAGCSLVAVVFVLLVSLTFVRSSDDSDPIVATARRVALREVRARGAKYACATTDQRPM